MAQLHTAYVFIQKVVILQFNLKFDPFLLQNAHAYGMKNLDCYYRLLVTYLVPIQSCECNRC
jgi:hypothetical protein